MSIDGRENMLAANNGLHWTLPRAFLFRAGGCWGRVAEAGRARDSERRFWQGRDWACLVEYEHDQRRNRLTRRITTFRKAGRHYRRAEETNVQQLYKGSQLARELRKVSLQFLVAECARPRAQKGSPASLIPYSPALATVRKLLRPRTGALRPCLTEALLRKIGFRVRAVRGYCKFRFPKALVGLIARKQ